MPTRDLVRPPAASPARRPRALIASARVLSTDLTNKPSVERWQTEGWEFYDKSGELRDAISWLGNAMSRGRLVAGRVAPGGDEPEVVEEGLVADLVGNFAGGINGQTQMLRDATTMLSVPGVTYFVCDEGFVNWRTRSAEELDLRGGGRWIEINGPQQQDEVEVSGLVVKAWVPHARRHYEPDSAVRAALPILRELDLLTKHVEASAMSRLAGAGLLVIADEIDFPAPADEQAQDQFLALLMEAAQTAIQDRGSAAALVPITVRIPGEYVDKVKFISFATPFDEHSIELRDEARKRLATALDIPAEILLGLGDSNHWTAWQIEESSIKLHIEPMMQTICAALTTGFLRPTLEAAVGSGATIEGDPSEYLVWYDLSELTVRPDKSKDAFELYDRLVIDADALRRETGFDRDDEPDPTSRVEQLVMTMLKAAPSLAQTIPGLLDAIGLTGLAVAPPAVPAAPADPIEVPEVETPPGPPVRDTTPPVQPADPIAAGGALMASAAAEAGLVAATEAVVHRALEHAGNRARSLTKNRPRPDCVRSAPSADVHTCLDVVDAGLDPAALLAGAWDRVPAIADRYGVAGSAEGLTLVLNSYCHDLLASGQPHDPALLAAALGAAPPAELVEA